MDNEGKTYEMNTTKFIEYLCNTYPGNDSNLDYNNIDTDISKYSLDDNMINKIYSFITTYDGSKITTKIDNIEKTFLYIGKENVDNLITWDNLKKWWKESPDEETNNFIELRSKLENIVLLTNIKEITKEIINDIYKIKGTYIKYILLFFFFHIRKRFVDRTLVKYAQNNCNNIDNINKKCFITSSGTVSIISDYDITVNVPMSYEVVENYYKDVKKLFGKNSSVVFDTNIYLFANFAKRSVDVCTFNGVLKKNNEYKVTDNYIRKGDTCIELLKYCKNENDQRMWAYIAILRELKKPHPPELAEDIKKILAEQNRTIYDLASSKYAELERILAYPFDKEASEKQYIKHSIDYSEAQNDEEKCTAMLNGNYFSDEGLLTYGSYAIIILVTQMDIDFKKLYLKKNQILDCAYEIFAYINKHHYLEKDYDNYTISVSKYISRIYRVLSYIETNQDTKKRYETIFNNAELVKEKLRTNKDDASGLDAKKIMINEIFNNGLEENELDKNKLVIQILKDIIGTDKPAEDNSKSSNQTGSGYMQIKNDYIRLKNKLI
jgi:hypothetical protein